MIKVIVKKENGTINGFHIEGHSGYAERGSDIVCAAVSALAVNCVNSVEKFTDDTFLLDSDETRGMLDFCITGVVSDQADLLLKSLFLGLEEIAKTYENRYISVKNY